MHVRCLWLAAALVSLALSTAHAQQGAAVAADPAPPATASEPTTPPDDATAAATPSTTPVVTPTPSATPIEGAPAVRSDIVVDTGVIVDPELDTGVIVDPELDDAASADTRTTPIDSTAFVPTGDVRLVLQSRVGADLVWRNTREDVVEGTQIMLLETRLRRSETLRFVAGLRARHQIATREHATSEAGAVRHSLDVAPTAAYADITVGDGVHVRAGYQVTRMGRFDLFSATNILAVADLRSGAVSMPDAVDVAQPAVRLDWDATPWLNIQAIHVPFFQPHIVDFVEGDYAMFKTTQADVEAALDQIATPDDGSPPVDCSDPTQLGDNRCIARSRIRDFWRQMSRSGTAGLAAGGFGALGESPSLANPQGAIRMTARSPIGEVSLTIGSALEHLPSLFIDKAFQDATRPNLTTTQRNNRLASVTRPLDVEYNRYYVISTDGAMPLGPLQIGAELAYMFNRTLYSAQHTCSMQPGGNIDPMVKDCAFYAPTPEQTDMVHAALRVELAPDETLQVGLESFVAYALSEPPRPDRQAWLTLMDGRYMLGMALMARWSPAETGWTFEVSSAALHGPTFMITPRVQWQAIETLYVELGALWVEGASLPARVPAFTEDVRTPIRTPVDWAIGGMYSNVDQVFVGLKWTP